MIKEDIFISILKYGKDKGLGLITYDDIFDLAEKKGFITTEERNEIKNETESTETKIKSDILRNIFHECFNAGSDSNNPSSLPRRVMSMDSYFKLLQHEEVTDARKNAREARCYSLIAIIFSIGTILVSYILTRWEIKNPIEIKNAIKIEQTQIDNLVSKISSLSEELKTIINTQNRILKNTDRIK